MREVYSLQVKKNLDIAIFISIYISKQKKSCLFIHWKNGTYESQCRNKSIPEDKW